MKTLSEVTVAPYFLVGRVLTKPAHSGTRKRTTAVRYDVDQRGPQLVPHHCEPSERGRNHDAGMVKSGSIYESCWVSRFFSATFQLTALLCVNYTVATWKLCRKVLRFIKRPRGHSRFWSGCSLSATGELEQSSSHGWHGSAWAISGILGRLVKASMN
jgi:hypothetical protein